MRFTCSESKCAFVSFHDSMRRSRIECAVARYALNVSKLKREDASVYSTWFAIDFWIESTSVGGVCAWGVRVRGVIGRESWKTARDAPDGRYADGRGGKGAGRAR